MASFFYRQLENVAIISLLSGVLLTGIALGQGAGSSGPGENTSGAASKDKKDSKDNDKGNNQSGKGDNKADSGQGNASDRGNTSQQSSKDKPDSASRRYSSPKESNSSKDNNSVFFDKLRREWRDRNGETLPFRVGWWDDDRFGRLPPSNPLNSEKWRDRPYYWWQAASPDRISDFIAYHWQSPQYWDYGHDGYIYVEREVVYRDGKRYKAINQYYDEIYKIAHGAPEIGEDESAKMDWMPLGVFALVNENGADSGRVIQLAVSKKGIITGADFNKEENRAHPVEGLVDEQTQTAAWALADGTSKELVMETSIYNLTEPQCTILVFHGPKKAEVCKLVRLEEPAPSNKGK